MSIHSLIKNCIPKLIPLRLNEMNSLRADRNALTRTFLGIPRESSANKYGASCRSAPSGRVKLSNGRVRISISFLCVRKIDYG